MPAAVDDRERLPGAPADLTVRFQFPVNTDPVQQFHLFAATRILGVPVPGAALLLAALVVTCVVVGYSAWTWRIAAAERDAAARDAGSVAPAGEAG